MLCMYTLKENGQIEGEFGDGKWKASRKKLRKDTNETEDDGNENVSICSVHFTSLHFTDC